MLVRLASRQPIGRLCFDFLHARARAQLICFSPRWRRAASRSSPLGRPAGRHGENHRVARAKLARQSASSASGSRRPDFSSPPPNRKPRACYVTHISSVELGARARALVDLVSFRLVVVVCVSLFQSAAGAMRQRSADDAALECKRRTRDACRNQLARRPS